MGLTTLRRKKVTELTIKQIDELANHIVECMLEDRELLLDVARDQAREWSLKEYLEWEKEAE